ncbi:NUDIX domain-containing protein [Streptomyces indicus]|uniref:ADP-ribose pyrophosphatase YjhB, NUDIX family n=1 Tax=Streptomyces indicus TaxID=417292 RepID=A0A1G8X4N2_9ACTN|nr:NUDIX domain-containing protein [Streptomyces indicus]SDJ85599.1 ADP-ribose pyrophosphatase YjhB, NUDIX family [Streptomyces indicus]
MSEPVPSPAKSAKNSHCSTCGAPYADLSGWPRTCAVCGDVAYRNPLPVAVALQPVHDTEGMGLLVVTRAIEPARGQLALPGGFVDHDEDWRRALVRELHEETGIEGDDRDVRLADALSSPDGHLLLFGVLPPRPAAELPPFVPTAETSARSILRAPAGLGFPLHTVAAAAWFEGRYA